MKIITKVDELKAETLGRGKNFRLRLNFGLYSKKTIKYQSRKNVFKIHNHIDGSNETLSVIQLFTETLIGKAIYAGALAMEDNNND